MAVALSAVVLFMAACIGGGTSRSSPQEAASSGPLDGPFAIWPEDTRQQAIVVEGRLANGEDPWRVDPVRTARHFARAVLGWADAAIRPYEGPMACQPCLVVGRHDGAASVVVAVRRLVAGRWWSVSWVGEEDREYGVGITIRGSSVEVGLPRRGATSVSVTAGYGGREVTKTATGQTDLRFGLGFRPETPGHFLILFRDERGRVFAAQGSPLPAGDFAAG